MALVYLGIGSNLGDRMRMLFKGRISIDTLVGEVVAISGVYESEPWGFESSNMFLNQVIVVETTLEPQELLGQIMLIERSLGRKRNGVVCSDRKIDIDILFYEDQCINCDNLVIPHPRLHKRKFVLLPLNDIAADFQHPLLEKRIVRLLEECNDFSYVRTFSEGVESKCELSYAV